MVQFHPARVRWLAGALLWLAALAAPAYAAVVGRIPWNDAPSGFRLLGDDRSALLSRLVAADHATRSIDLQTYIYDDDPTGRLVARHLLAAADRGVHVRLLVDDLDASESPALFDALDAHPRIEVRLFNAFLTHRPSLVSKLGQFVIDGRRLNRRMHNKSFISDGRVAIVGGRNIGDPYYDAGGDVRFRDLDLAAVGPVVAQATAAFETYWTCDAARPVSELPPTGTRLDALNALRRDLPSNAAVIPTGPAPETMPAEWPTDQAGDTTHAWDWGRAALVADEPEKAGEGRGGSALRIAPAVDALIASARREVVLISAYFAPGDHGARYFEDLARRGVALSLLTNSLAATDAPAVHAGYAEYRQPLLDAGVDLYELRPIASVSNTAESEHGPSRSPVSLHAKAAIVDSRYVFVGSMNMDLRSRLLNTEMGLIVDDPPLASAVYRYYRNAIQPQNAFHVVESSDGGLQWLGADATGAPLSYDHEPDASWWRRIETTVLGWLPIDELL
jgi:cardiolipin synthase C